MENPPQMKNVNFLFPEEKVLDRLRFRAFKRACSIILTDRRVLVSGHTGALAPHFTLLRGGMVCGFPLVEFDHFIVGAGRRPLLLISSVIVAVAGAVMMAAPWARYLGLAIFFASLIMLAIWLAWPRTFITVSSRVLRISGQVKLGDACLFLERLQLAAEAAKSGASPEQVRSAIDIPGSPAPEEYDPDSSKEIFPAELWECDGDSAKEEAGSD